MKKIMIGFLFLSLNSWAQYQTYFKNFQWQVSQKTVRESRHGNFTKELDIPNIAVLRFHFEKTKLGENNYLEVKFSDERKPLILSDRVIQGFSNASPYLSGGNYNLRLVVKNKHDFKNLKIHKLEVIRNNGKQVSSALCGEDDRVGSNEARMGRMMRDREGSGGCSGGMFSKSCLITAGHCLGSAKIVEFNVPQSTKTGSPVAAKPEDQYAAEVVLGTMDEGVGNDWAVIRFKTNPITGKYPGEAQGHYEINYNPLNLGDVIRITGYGTDSEKTKSRTQQTDTGELKLFKEALGYHVDTMSGNSGTPVLDEVSDTIIGVHTHGGCDSRSEGFNYGTSLHINQEFQAAVKACLKSSELR